MKLTVILSPNTKTGTTTVGNYLATSLAKKTNMLTLYIEFSKVTGRSLFFHGRAPENRRSITEVMYDPKSLQKQIVRSKYTEFMHFLCMNLYEDFLHMTTYVPSSMANIITEASRYYEHIILDLPANFEEPIVGTVLSRNFEHRVDNFICVLDEDVLTAKLLYDLEALLKMGKESQPKELTYVINKVTEHYIDYLEASLNIGLVVPVNLIKLPYILDIKDCTNRADVYKLGYTNEVKKFYHGIDQLRDIVTVNRRGIGLDKSTMLESRQSLMGDDEDSVLSGKKKGKGKKSGANKLHKPGFLERFRKSGARKDDFPEYGVAQDVAHVVPEVSLFEEDEFESLTAESSLESSNSESIATENNHSEEVTWGGTDIDINLDFDEPELDVGTDGPILQKVPVGVDAEMAWSGESHDALSEDGEFDPFSSEFLGEMYEGGEVDDGRTT